MNVYLEGGNHLRVPMRGFLRRAVGDNINLDVRPCRDRGRAIRLFSQTQSSDSLLLIDSDGADLNSLRQDVLTRTNSLNARERSFFMVQLMEAWFLADRECLASYYGASFRAGRLPGNQPEAVAKNDAMDRLRQATQDTPKGAYHKTDHSPDLLHMLNPSAVYNACPNFALLIDHLRDQRVG